MASNGMPVINLDSLSGAARMFAERITIHGRLRASKPPVEKVKVPHERYGYTYEPADPDAGRAAYIWRMVAFQISPIDKHQCMPCTADFDLPGDFDARRADMKRLDEIVDQIVNTVPASDWHGIRRWGNALGLLGTPRYTAEGAVIYR